MHPIVDAIVSRFDGNLREAFDERAAILQFDAGQTREMAEALALLVILQQYPDEIHACLKGQGNSAPGNCTAGIVEEEQSFFDEQSGATLKLNRYYGFGDAGSLAGSFEGYATLDEAIQDIRKEYPEDQLGTAPEQLGEVAICILSGTQFAERLTKKLVDAPVPTRKLSPRLR